jgi:hypothetical protein
LSITRHLDNRPIETKVQIRALMFSFSKLIANPDWKKNMLWTMALIFTFLFPSHSVDDNSNHWPIDRKILTKPNFDLVSFVRHRHNGTEQKVRQNWLAYKNYYAIK